MQIGIGRSVAAMLSVAVIAGCGADRATGPDATEQSAVRSVSASGLAATAVSQSRIDLAWTDDVGNEAGFEIHRSTTGAVSGFALHSTTAPNTTAFSDVGLTASTEYCYLVRSFRTTGKRTTHSAFTDPVCATTLAPPYPNAPASLDAIPRGGPIDLSWSDRSTDETGFRIERSLDRGATWAMLRTLGPNATYVGDYDVAPEREFCYRVIAFNAQGDSPPSNTDCATRPTAPTGLALTEVAGPAVQVTWTDASAVETGYEVHRYEEGSSYRRIALLPAGSTSHLDATVSGDQTYFYYVLAVKDGGGAASATASIVVASTPPAAPGTAFAAPSWSSTAVTVTWDDRSSNEEGFRIERSTDDGATWETAGTATWAYLGFGDGERTSEQLVCYRVFAFNRHGESAPSGTGCTTPPAAPTDVAAAWVEGGVQVTWRDNSAVEDSYWVVIYTVCSGQPDYWYALPANTTSFTVDPSPWMWCGALPTGYGVAPEKDGGYGDVVFAPPPE